MLHEYARPAAVEEIVSWEIFAERHRIANMLGIIPEVCYQAVPYRMRAHRIAIAERKEHLDDFESFILDRASNERMHASIEVSIIAHMHTRNPLRSVERIAECMRGDMRLVRVICIKLSRELRVRA